MSTLSRFHLSATLTLAEARGFMEACLDPASEPEAVGRALPDICALHKGESAMEAVLPLRDVLDAGGQAVIPPKTTVRGRRGRSRP